MKMRGWMTVRARVFARLMTAACALLIAGAAAANMQLDRTQVVFNSGGPNREDVVVNNPGDEPLYVKVDVLKVTSPGTEAEQRIIVDNPEEIGMIATPPKFIVAPGGRKVLRLVNLSGHGNVESVFRVNVVPVAPPAESKGIGVRVLIAYQLLVFVRPKTPRFDIAAHRDGSRLIVENRGNTNFLLRDIQHCGEGKESCRTLPGKRVYAGTTIELEVPPDGTLSLNATGADQTRKLVF